jgi:hypothetical protein
MRRLILDVHCLHDQQEADCGQGYVDVFQERIALEAVVEGSAQEDGGQGEWKRDQVVVGDGGNPEACEPVADHSDEAGGQKISLQGSAEVGRGPASHGAVNDEWGAVHPVGSAQDTSSKSTGEEPEAAVAMQDERRAADEGVNREEGDDHA